MRDQSLPRRAALAEQQVQHARREVRLLEQPDQGHRGQRGQLAGLDHRRVARGQRRRELPGDLQQRVVPRRDQRADADRLVHDAAHHPRPARVHHPARVLSRHPGVEAEHAGAEAHLGAGLGRLSQKRLQVRPCRQIGLAQGHRLRRHVARAQPVEGVAEEDRGACGPREACRERGQREVVADDLGERVLHLQTALELVALRPDLTVERLEAQARLVLGGVQASVDDGDRGGLRESIEQLHVER